MVREKQKDRKVIKAERMREMDLDRVNEKQIEIERLKEKQIEIKRLSE